MNSVWPLRMSLFEELATLRARFLAHDPFPSFVLIQRFLDVGALKAPLRQLEAAAFKTYCGWSNHADGRELHAGFRELDEAGFFVTVHQRPVVPVPGLDKLADAIGTRACLSLLSQMTGLTLRLLGRPAVLTSWGPGSFIGRHSDAGPVDNPVQLVLSLSLTRSWLTDYGGTTTYASETDAQTFTVDPEFNCATIFRPRPHWVSPVASHGPKRSRYTWTLHFR
jgi:2OG-Fe(II) oxygenase superfamily